MAILQSLTLNGIDVEDKLANLNDKITIYKKEDITTTLSDEGVHTITSVSVPAGTYLVFGGFAASCVTTHSDCSFNFMACVNTSTSYNHKTGATVPNVESLTSSIQCMGLFTVTSTTDIYLLTYVSTAMTVQYGRLYAIKID